MNKEKVFKLVEELIIDHYPDISDNFRLDGHAYSEATYLFDVGNTALDIYNALFSPEGISKSYTIDEEANQPTNYGFVMNQEGVIHHLHYQYNHGLVLAELHPEKALEHGYYAPRLNPEYNYLSVYDYQDFEFKVADSLGYIRFGGGFYYRLGHSREILNEKQVAQFKKWLYNSDLVDYNIMTEVGDLSGQQLISELSKLAQHNKLNGYMLTVPDNEDIIEPDDNF